MATIVTTQSTAHGTSMMRMMMMIMLIGVRGRMVGSPARAATMPAILKGAVSFYKKRRRESSE
jgi:hypothetical protein